MRIGLGVELARYGQVWPQMTRHGQIWPDMPDRVPDMARKARYSQIGPDMVRYGQIWPDMIRHGQIWPDMIPRTLVQDSDSGVRAQIISIEDPLHWGASPPNPPLPVGLRPPGSSGIDRWPLGSSGIEDSPESKKSGFCFLRLRPPVGADRSVSSRRY